MEAKPEKKSYSEIIIPDTPTIKCPHYFEFAETGVKCKKCGLGLLGVMELKDGKPVI